jgi:hypothetical protein
VTPKAFTTSGLSSPPSRQRHSSFRSRESDTEFSSSDELLDGSSKALSNHSTLCTSADHSCMALFTSSALYVGSSNQSTHKLSFRIPHQTTPKGIQIPT